MQLTPEQIEKFRAIGLKLDRAGTLWHQGTAVTHARLRQALLRWLDVLKDGRDIVRLDEKRYAYVDVEDAHLRALSLRWDGDRALVTWDDDQVEQLAYETLRQADDNAIYVKARTRLRGRIAGAAYHALAEHVVEDAGSFVLVAAGKRWPIAR